MYNSPDLLLLAAAVGVIAVAVVIAAFVAVGAPRARRTYHFVGAALWACFATGLLLEAFAPRLAIEHNMFVVPERAPYGQPITDPIRLVQMERHMQLASASFLILSCVGLAIYYRVRLFSLFRRV